jgi:hypothetical protein
LRICRALPSAATLSFTPPVAQKRPSCTPPLLARCCSLAARSPPLARRLAAFAAARSPPLARRRSFAAARSPPLSHRCSLTTRTPPLSMCSDHARLLNARSRPPCLTRADTPARAPRRCCCRVRGRSVAHPELDPHRRVPAGVGHSGDTLSTTHLPAPAVLTATAGWLGGRYPGRYVQGRYADQ